MSFFDNDLSLVRDWRERATGNAGPTGPSHSCRQHLTIGLCLAFVALSACGGGSGGGIGGSNGPGGVVAQSPPTTYTIGGTLLDLPVGSKVTLSDNGGDSMVLTASGSFTFGRTVPAGGSYSVTVNSKPVGQTCTPKGASGVDVTANVTTVIITCSAAESVLHSFGSGTDGSEPAGLIQASDGDLYGVSAGGGTNNTGTVFTITPSGIETIVYSFGPRTGIDGQAPNGPLLQGSDGNFYGVTEGGGTNGTGTVFRMSPSGAATILYSFGPITGADGQVPSAGLIQANDGNFYGTTIEGGTNHTGTIFQITPAGAEKIVYSFGAVTGTDGQSPTGGLIQAGDGNLYGTTVMGGANGTGTVFTITPSGVETILYSFGAGPEPIDGKEPSSGLIQASDGNFYGVTPFGGTNGTGTVFRMSPAGNVATLYSFEPATAGSHGSNPSARLIQANDGNFYGVTEYGGANNTGTVFQFTLSGTGSTLYSFGTSSATDATNPEASLIQGTDGSLYGTTWNGGTYQTSGIENFGTVFKIN
jgi:uncharacterized repeat protein (TIGR03803 family)